MRPQFFALTLLLGTRVATAQETAMVMPKGIFRIRAIGVVTQPVETRFDGQGNRIQLLSPLNRTVTAGEQADQNAELKTLYDKLNEYQAGLGDSLFQTDLSTTSQIDVQQRIMVVDYGLTEKISLGLMMPFIKNDVKSSFRAQSSSNVEALKSRLAGMDPLVDGLNQFASQIPGTTDYEKILFTDRGYEVPGDYVTSGMGDVELAFKYKILDTKTFLLSVQPMVRMPTAAHTENYRRLLDLGTGDKQLDVMSYLFVDYNPTANLTFGSAARYTIQMADKIHRPVPRPGETMLPDLTDDNSWDDVNRNLGDMADTELSTTYRFFGQTLSIHSAYQYLHKMKDSYSGSKDYLDYAKLEVDTDVTAHRYQAGIGYSTIPLYFKKKFAVPFELQYIYNSTFSGKNTPKVSYNRLNFFMYF